MPGASFRYISEIVASSVNAQSVSGEFWWFSFGINNPILFIPPTVVVG